MDINMRYVVVMILLYAFSFGSVHAQEKTNLFVYSKTNGYRHGSIPDGAKAIWDISIKHDWSVTFSEDSTLFTKEYLSNYDVVVFLNTTQDVVGDAGQEAFEAYINNGGGFVGIHAATDTEYDWPWYDEMIGAHFASHPKTQEATMNVHKNCDHQSIAHLGDTWTKVDEWYNFKKPVPNYVSVLLDLDESTTEGKKMGGYHPIAWYHSFEGGRVFYTGLGHTPETFQNPDYITHLTEGIKWAAGLSHVRAPKEWTPLLDPSLKRWDKFMGVPHTTVDGIDEYEKSEDVHVGIPMRLNDPKNVFKMIKLDGEDVVHVSGEIYGGLTSKEEYGNYHLKLKFKWGEKKWEPRLNALRDAGLLYHCVGKHGAFWNVWMQCLELQIQEGDCGDLFALAGNNAVVPSFTTDDKLKYKFVKGGQLYPVGSEYGNYRCVRSEDHEYPNGEWNTIELYTVGSTAIHVVNGHVVNVVVDAHQMKDGVKSPLLRGKIQLQSEAAEIFYKDVQIKEILEIPVGIKEQAGL